MSGQGARAERGVAGVGVGAVSVDVCLFVSRLFMCRFIRCFICWFICKSIYFYVLVREWLVGEGFPTLCAGSAVGECALRGCPAWASGAASGGLAG